MELPTCLMCGESIEPGADSCPACKVALKRCANDQCGQALPLEVEFCPFCGSENKREAAENETVAEAPCNLASIDATDSVDSRETIVAPAEPGSPSTLAIGNLPGTELGHADVLQADINSSAMLATASIGGMIGQSQISAFDEGMADLGPSVMGESSAPVRLEFNLSAKLRIGQKGLLRLRITSDVSSNRMRLCTRCDSEVLESPVEFQRLIEPGEAIELDPIRFVPRNAGADIIQITIEASNRQNVPLGRYEALRSIEVEDPSSPDSQNRIEAGGDVIIMGNAGGQLGFPGLTHEPFEHSAAESWRTLPLRVDTQFARRLARIRPHQMPPQFPAIPGGASAGGQVLDSAVRFEYASGETLGLLVTTARACGIGRGGIPVVRWLIHAPDGNAQQEARLSRCHAVFQLDKNLAWVEDRSTNGVWLNDKRIARGKAEILADGDELNFADVVSFAVRLGGNQAGVRSIWLTRSDITGQLLAYAMVDPREPMLVPDGLLGSPDATWMAWRRGNAEDLEMQVSDGSADWTAITEGARTRLAAGMTVEWQSRQIPTDLLQSIASGST